MKMVALHPISKLTIFVDEGLSGLAEGEDWWI